MFNHFAEESMGSDGPMHIERHHMSSARTRRFCLADGPGATNTELC